MRLLCIYFLIEILATLPIFASEAFVPSSGDTVLLELSPSMDYARLRKLHSMARSQPDKRIVVDLVADYIDRGKEESDPRYFGMAKNLLKPWEKIADPGNDLLWQRAYLHQYTHNFDLALADLETLTKNKPDSAQAWLLKAGIEQTIGNFTAAEKSCAPLITLTQGLVHDTCRYSTQSMNGKLADSFAKLRKSYDSAHSIAPTVRSWTAQILGEMAWRQLLIQEARHYFKEALLLYPKNLVARNSAIDFLLAQNDFRQALEMIDLAPQTSLALRLRKVLATKKLSGGGDTQAMLKLRHEFQIADQLKLSAQREATRFYISLQPESDKALRLAEENWQIQKEPIDLELFLDALLLKPDPKSTQTLVAWIADNAYEDARLISKLAGLKKL